MTWIICYIISLLILIATICLFIRRRFILRSGSSVSIRVLFIGFFFMMLFMMFPIQLDGYAGDSAAVIKALFGSLNRTMRSFVLTDINYMSRSLSIDPGLYDAYSITLMLLCFACPLISLSYILSFFSRVRASVGFLFSRRRDLYVFSHLNDQSVALASDLCAHHKHCRIVFCSTGDVPVSSGVRLIHSAELIHAICFSKDIRSVRFNAHSKKKQIVFYMIGSDEQRNTSDALELIDAYRDRADTTLYLFSCLTESALAIADADCGRMRVRRINHERSMVYRFLYDHGEELFREAYRNEDGTKRISVLLIGLGRNGSEMLKTLTWYCQMDGYHLTVDAFDRSTDAQDRLTAECPELFDADHNGTFVDGEASYTVRFRTGVDFRSAAFARLIDGIDHPTMAFIALGDDSVNIDAAVLIRTLFARKGADASVYAIITDPEKAQMVGSVKNFKGQLYDIRCVGDIRSSYSEHEIINSEIEQEALRLHCMYGREEDFWRYEYYYLSSMARAIHLKARAAVGQAADEADVGILEHKRWNAFIRSQGYIYSGSVDSSTRNDLAKLHNDLVPFDCLSEEEKAKDIVRQKD